MLYYWKHGEERNGGKQGEGKEPGELLHVRFN